MKRWLTGLVAMGAAAAAVIGLAGTPAISIGSRQPRAPTELTAVQRHWEFPVPLQGEAPADFTDAERSLQPSACGTCHPAQLALWSGSRHAAATGPGIHAQMLVMQRSNPSGIEDCSRCHFPMTEQHVALGGAPNPAYDAELYASGLSCAACHVRGNTRYGPPRRAAPPDTSAHGGFIEAELFTTSEFCATCHQFPDDWPALNGKLLENTYEEWKASSYYAQGVQCQTCHMPDRNHLWRGIHDPETTRHGVAIGLTPAQGWADGVVELRVENTGVGHMFPTYVTPSIIVDMVQLGAGGDSIEGTAQTHYIGRYIPIDLSTEIYDTRIAPGDAATFAYDREAHTDAAELLVTITVDPDEFYRRFYLSRLEGALDADVQSAYFEALADTQRNVYVLWQARLPR